MSKRLMLILLFCLLNAVTFGKPITTSNYKYFIGRKIKFSEKISDDQVYRIANKKFSAKKYNGKILTISNIEIDKKGNLVLFLSEILDNKKEKIIKLKTKTQEITLENIYVIYPPKPPKKETKRILPEERKEQYIKTSSNSLNNESGTEGVGWIVLFLIGIIVVIYVIKSEKNKEMIEEVTTLKRGENSERSLILQLRKQGIEAKYIFHDLYVPNKGKFSQIDLVVLSSVGVIVFEVKDYSGWIFGNGKQQYWTQVLNYGKEKYRFYNPVMQNARHIIQLRKYLRMNIPCFSVIVFYGNCELKQINFIPSNTFITRPWAISNVLNNIFDNNNSIQYDDKIFDLLSQTVKYGSEPNIKEKHVEQINDMLGKDRIFR